MPAWTRLKHTFLPLQGVQQEVQTTEMLGQ